MPTRVPSRDDITDDTPLRLEAAAAFGWPGGGMTAAALRREIASGRLEAEFLAGKHWTTLAAIRELRERCRVQVAEPVSMPRDAKASRTSVTARERATLAALEQIANEPNKRAVGPRRSATRGAKA